MTALLVTLIVLLADGSPGKHAWLSCPELTVARIGSDGGELAEKGSALVLDSRGACIIQAPAPVSIACEAYYGTQRWVGRVALTRERKVVTIGLEETDGNPEF